MLPEIQVLITELEDRKLELLKDLEVYSSDQLRFQPAPDRWSMLMALQHIVLGEQGIRSTEAELRHNPVRQRLKPGNMFNVVILWSLMDQWDWMNSSLFGIRSERSYAICWKR
jgi:hypothetical protein